MKKYFSLFALFTIVGCTTLLIIGDGNTVINKTPSLPDLKLHNNPKIGIFSESDTIRIDTLKIIK